MSDQLPATTADTPAVSKGGKYPLSVDLAEVERLASLGMNQAQIAEGLGTGKSTWLQHKANNSEFADAYKRGQLEIRVKVLQRLEAAADKNFAVPMFMSKQQHILGFSDQAMDVKHGGKIEIVVTDRVMGAEEQAPAIDITDQSKAIEGDS